MALDREQVNHDQPNTIHDDAAAVGELDHGHIDELLRENTEGLNHPVANVPSSQEISTSETLGTTELGDDNNNNKENESETHIDVPTLEDQRSIINRYLSEQESLPEGSELNVLPFSWFQSFLYGDFKDAADANVQLGPIDTSNIIDNSGIFADQEKYPFVAVSVDIFKKLVDWYTLSHGSSPVTTYLVENQGRLEPEFSKPFFYVHHLVADNSSSTGYHYNTSYSSIPSFTLSLLNSCDDLIKKAIETLDQKEHISKYSLNTDDHKYKVWVIHDDNLVNLNYQISPTDFMNLKNKYLVKKEHNNLLIKDTGLRINHLVVEQKLISHNTKKSESYWPSNYFIQFPPTPSDGRIGLQNLGNTCYMNSALQCLVHIPELTQYFLFNCYRDELNPDNPLGMSGKVASTFAKLIHNLFDKKSSRGSSIIPRDFKQTIGYFNSMFADYHQQDSQEFLAFLLDGLHEDLNRIIKKPSTEKPELNEKNADLEAIKELTEKSWNQHKLRNDSVIIDLFVGLYKSTLICPVCSKISITFDPFSDLTLPLPTEKVWNSKITLFLEAGPIKSFEVELSKNSTYGASKSYVAEKLNLKADHLFTAEIFNHQFYKNFETSDSQSSYLPIQDLIAEGDVIVMYEIKHTEGDTIVPVFNTVLPPTSNIPDTFAIPFFIVLSESERKSFGVIRKKLEDKYEQLSTFQYFTKIRENQSGKKFTSKDFPLLTKTKVQIAGTDMAHDKVEIKAPSDDGYDSEVSLANPDLSGDYAFKIKLFDSSKEVRTRRKNYQYSRYNSHSLPSSDPTTETTKFWTPTTSNNFTNLPDLLDLVEESKRAYYTYGKQLDIDNSNENSDVSIETPETSSEENKDTIIDDTITTNQDNNGSDDDKLVGPLLSDDEDDEETPDIDMNLESNTHNAQEQKQQSACPKTEKGTTEIILIQQDLVKERMALVCEWTPEFFDIFFSGLEDEGEGGNNTWTNPQVLVNEEVEILKKERAAKKDNVLNLDNCLRLFSKPEVLGEHDLWYCSDCKEHRQASKQIEIWSTPDILSIHLKRFENQRSFSDKIDAVVEFPIESLDMEPYISKTMTDGEDSIYDLFAVDNHYGGIGGGHYTSYVKNFVDNRWYYYDDSRVSSTSPEKAITGAAYLLFYRKRSVSFLGGERLSELIEKAREDYEERERQELRLQQEFYESNRNDSSEEEEEDGFEEASDSSEDNISSVHVGTDDEDDLSSSRRKLRLLGRAKKHQLIDNSNLQSDIESSALGSPSSIPSDDNASTYSASNNAPAGQPYAINSPRP